MFSLNMNWRFGTALWIPSTGKGAGDRALLGDVRESAGKNRRGVGGKTFWRCACAPGIGRVEFFPFAAMEYGNFNLESFCPLRRRGGVRQLPKEKFPRGKS
jgi:hypothetical protein